MLDLEDINRTIGQLEEGRTSPQNCTLLASLYIVRDHFQGAPANIRTSAKASGIRTFDKQMAEEWTREMKNEDGTTGPHWTMEQTNQIMTQRGINCDPAEFYAAMNMVYSDYSKVAKKLNVSNIDFYAEIAKAFLDDQDAAPDKLARYYEFVVKH